MERIWGGTERGELMTQTGDTSREHTKGYSALSGIPVRRRQGPTLTEMVGGCSEGIGKDIPMAKVKQG